MNLLDLIKQRRAVCDAATAGPWAHSERGFGKRDKPTVFATDTDLRYVAFCSDAYCVGEPTDNQANAAFIAASRNERPSELDALAIAVEALDLEARMHEDQREIAYQQGLNVYTKIYNEERAKDCRRALAQIRAKLENTDAKS